jgi:hypothetical protein
MTSVFHTRPQIGLSTATGRNSDSRPNGDHHRLHDRTATVKRDEEEYAQQNQQFLLSHVVMICRICSNLATMVINQIFRH